VTVPAVTQDGAQSRLRETAAEFTRIRGALQQAGALPVVVASKASRVRVAALNARAAAIQKTIEGAGRMVDGARKWFADTFGASVEDTVPLANPTIAASIQTSIAAMNYFLRDAKAELNAIIARQKQYEAAPEDKRAALLSGLGADTAPDVAAQELQIRRNWIYLGIAAVAVAVFLKGKGDDDEM
jgi:hypothetical protein